MSGCPLSGEVARSDGNVTAGRAAHAIVITVAHAVTAGASTTSMLRSAHVDSAAARRCRVGRHRGNASAEQGDYATVTFVGTHVPLSIWALVTMLAGVAVSVIAFRPLARSQGRRPVPTLFALLLFTGTLALTATPDGDRPPLGLAACIPEGWNDLFYNVTHEGGGLGGVLLNILLFLPLAATVVLATCRVWPAVAVSLLPPAVELVQTVLPGRSCGVSDLLTNVTGVLLGVAMGCAVQRRGERMRRDAGAHPPARRGPTIPTRS